MGVVRFGFVELLGRPVDRISTKHPPPQPRHTQQRDREGDGHREPGGNPFTGENDQGAYAGTGAGSGSVGIWPDSRRSRSGMKLRTGGTFAKLYGGGGEVVAPSRVLPCHGSSPAISPLRQLRMTLMKKSSTEKAMRNDDVVMIALVVAQAGLAYVAMRRGIPSKPSVCMIKNVPLKPMNSVQKFHSPSVRLNKRPVILGNQ